MKIAVMGAGGVGGYFGARLAAGGADVAFIARGEHLRAIQREGLRVESGLGDVLLKPAQATDHAASVGLVDFVLFTVKLWSTSEAARELKPLLGPETAVISFQNGVDAVAILSEELGRPHVMGGVAHIGAVIERPGVIRHNGTLARLTFGELDGRRSSRLEALLAACLGAGIDAHLSDDIQRAIWEKFVFLVGLSGMTSLTRTPIGPIREDPVTRAMLLEVMREAASVGRAEGANLPKDIAEKQLAFADGLPYDMISSMLGDLNRGNRLELEWLSGAVARLGEQHGIATPANRFIHAALKLHARGLK
ncbi:MAG TPA: 2-dehydropantoate 2-reductase [Burkholderiales bacterium]|nr:2-dehydropantoate 2-reductase [Burkholderiales bacterium]